MSTLEMHNSYDDSVVDMLTSPPRTALAANPSGLRPKGFAVLVRPYEAEEFQGLIAIPQTVRDSAQMLEQRAVMIEAGPEAWRDESRPRALPGEKVLIAKYAGHFVRGTKDGVAYRMVNDRDIFCGLEEQGNV